MPTQLHAPVIIWDLTARLYADIGPKGAEALSSHYIWMFIPYINL
jgi:hypothetical protein